ncbi:hypothetical protein [Plantactinospora sp. ZYX-F-223]|uniref:hypothetical protein n=1 Tax=Plantactinospora sp. ZYX-F-223 TaxID=3144103 RepID=UPI0031FD68C1
MLHLFRRRSPETEVRFCDGCAEVTTADQRARRRYEECGWRRWVAESRQPTQIGRRQAPTCYFEHSQDREL